MNGYKLKHHMVHMYTHILSYTGFVKLYARSTFLMVACIYIVMVNVVDVDNSR